MNARRWLVAGMGTAAAIAVVVACSDDPPSGTAAGSDAGADTQGMPRVDGGRYVGNGDDDDSVVSPDVDAGDCDEGNIVINELEPAGDGGAEFVELYNSNRCALSLASFKLMYRSGTNVPGVGALHTFGTGDAIRSHTFVLLANDKFVGKKDGDLSGSMGNTAGQVALINDVGDIVDAVGYGDVKDAGPIKEAGSFTEGKPVALQPDTVSIGRIKDGVDTDDNSVDFKAFSKHTAGVSNE